jgi:cyclopropane fatty-acyl-phospholipid synthase-like methyltransferase
MPRPSGCGRWWRGCPTGRSPEAVQAANEQHYGLPPQFLGLILGPLRKYSGCLWPWPEGSGSLEQAEEAMLELSCERAGIEDGMRVLDLGCGWGSLTLWLAERYPACSVLGVSNSGSPAWILGEVARRGLPNVSVETADVNTFDPGRARFDRVMSIEMFEHVRATGASSCDGSPRGPSPAPAGGSSMSSPTARCPTCSRAPGRPPGSSPPG